MENKKREKLIDALRNGKVIKAVKEIQAIERELEEHTARVKQIIKEKKANINQIALDNIDEVTQELLSYIKFGMGFPVSNFTSFNTSKLKAKVFARCPFCGAHTEIEVMGRERYLRHMNGKEEITQICEECETRYKLASIKRENERNAYIENLRNMPYKEYLQTEHWLEFRKRVLKRYNYKCQLCGKPGKLNVHHNNYDHRGYEDYRDVLLLCQECHAKHHDKVGD